MAYLLWSLLPVCLSFLNMIAALIEDGPQGFSLDIAKAMVNVPRLLHASSVPCLGYLLGNTGHLTMYNVKKPRRRLLLCMCMMSFVIVDIVSTIELLKAVPFEWELLIWLADLYMYSINRCITLTTLNIVASTWGVQCMEFAHTYTKGHLSTTEITAWQLLTDFKKLKKACSPLLLFDFSVIAIRLVGGIYFSASLEGPKTSALLFFMVVQPLLILNFALVCQDCYDGLLLVKDTVR